MDEPDSFPIDMERAVKGAVIPQREIASIVGAKVHTAAYRVGLLSLRDEMERRIRAAGQGLTVTTHNNELNILTDADAARYNANLFDWGRKRMFKANRQLATVDTSGFDAREKADHRRTLVIQGAVIAGMSGGRKSVQARPYRRLSHAITS